MRWLILGVFLCTIFILKIYLINGYKAIFGAKIGLFIGVIFLLTFPLGIYTVYTSFRSGLVNMNSVTNLIIGAMFTVFVFEILVLPFFIVDDLSFKLKSFFSSNSPMDISRRYFIKNVGIIVATVPFISFVYGITKGKYNFKVFKKTLYFDDLPEAFNGFKIAQFSDFHAGSFDDIESVKKGFELIQNERPDTILFTGDLVNESEKEIIPFKSMFKNLKAPFGKFSVLGNHDYMSGGPKKHKPGEIYSNLQAIIKHHKDCDFNLLNNQNKKITINGESIRIVGVENWGRYPFPQIGNLDIALDNTQADEFCVLLSHDPTHWDERVKDHPKKIQLTLSGHTHGAQMGVELPWLKWSPVKYVYPKWAGLYEEAKQKLYVNRGFGFLLFAGRVGIRPEITILELQRKV